MSNSTDLKLEEVISNHAQSRRPIIDVLNEKLYRVSVDSHFSLIVNDFGTHGVIEHDDNDEKLKSFRGVRLTYDCGNWAQKMAGL